MDHHQQEEKDDAIDGSLVRIKFRYVQKMCEGLVVTVDLMLRTLWTSLFNFLATFREWLWVQQTVS